MKKIKLLSLTFVMVLPFFIQKSTHASCYGILVVDNIKYGCSDSQPWNSLPDSVNVSISDKKITLNNYNGGPIGITSNDYNFDGNYNIELIGNNIITAAKFAEPGSESKPYTDFNVAFYNINPTFSGSGSLTIINETDSFDLSYSDEHNNSIVSIVTHNGEEAVNPSAQEDETTTGSTTQEEEHITTEEQTNNKASNDSFFETPAGITILIAVPSILTIVIIALLIMLFNKKKSTPPFIDNVDQNQ